MSENITYSSSEEAVTSRITNRRREDGTYPPVIDDSVLHIGVLVKKRMVNIPAFEPLCDWEVDQATKTMLNTPGAEIRSMISQVVLRQVMNISSKNAKTLRVLDLDRVEYTFSHVAVMDVIHRRDYSDTHACLKVFVFHEVESNDAILNLRGTHGEEV